MINYAIKGKNKFSKINCERDQYMLKKNKIVIRFADFLLESKF